MRITLTWDEVDEACRRAIAEKTSHMYGPAGEEDCRFEVELDSDGIVESLEYIWEMLNMEEG